MSSDDVPRKKPRTQSPNTTPASTLRYANMLAKKSPEEVTMYKKKRADRKRARYHETKLDTTSPSKRHCRSTVRSKQKLVGAYANLVAAEEVETESITSESLSSQQNQAMKILLEAKLEMSQSHESDSETPEARARRLHRERSKMYHKNMTPEQRERRLQRMRDYKKDTAGQRMITRQQQKIMQCGIAIMESFTNVMWENVSAILNGVRGNIIQKLLTQNKTGQEISQIASDLIEGGQLDHDRIAYLKVMCYGHLVKSNKVASQEEFDKLLKTIDFVASENAAIYGMVEGLLSKTLEQLKNHLKSPIKQHPNHSIAEHTRVKLLRLQYHLARKDADDPSLPEAQTMEVLLPKLIAKQITGIEEDSGTLNEEEVPLLEEVEPQEVINDALDPENDQPIAQEEPSEDETENVPQPEADKKPSKEDLLEARLLEQAKDAMADDEQELASTAPHLLQAEAHKSTMIRQCGNKCEVMSVKQANHIFAWLLKMCNHTAKDFTLEMLEQPCPEVPDSTVPLIVDRFAPCSAGLRTVHRRLVEIRRYAKCLEKMRLIHEQGDFDDLQQLLSDTDLPVLVRRHLREYANDKDDDRHTLQNTKAKYWKNLDVIKEEMEKGQTHLCDICDTFEYAKGLRQMRHDDVLEAARPPNPKAVYDVCQSCRKSLKPKQGDPKMPKDAIRNFMEVPIPPDELKNLNWVERSLIRQVLPIQHMFNLHDKGGRRTKVRAVQGGLVFVPVPVEGTLKHVGSTLPQHKDTTIRVTTSQNIRIVNLPRVFQALKWLRANNPLYSEIEIDENFRLHLNEDVFIDENLNIPDKDKFVEEMMELNVNATDTVLEHQAIDLVPTISVDGDAPKGTPLEAYKLKHCRYTPLGLHHRFIDALSFPWLHPTGRFGLDDPERQDPYLTLRMYIRNRLANRNRTFAMDMEWLCFMHGLCQQIDIRNSLSTSVRISRNRLTADQVKDMIDGKDDKMLLCTASTFNKLRGHSPYWHDVKTKLNAHIQAYGQPTWFVTLNPNVEEWEEVHTLYKLVHNCPVNASNIQEFVAKDPYIWTQFFQHRLKTVLKKLICANNSPFGEVTHFFYRIEYQGRGHEHAHMFLWVKNPPKAGASREEIARYIDSVVTARLPDPVHERELYLLVNNHQSHWKKHSNTCKRSKKTKSGNHITICRFDFPRPVRAETTVEEDVLSGISSTNNRFYYLRRRKCERYINDYCPSLTLAWRGNTDVQYIETASTKIIDYVSGYATKQEKSQRSNEIKELLYTDCTSREAFATFMNLIRQRTIGALELVDLLMGNQMYRFDSTHVNINLNEDDKRYRVLKDERELVGSSEAFVENWYDTWYPQRPAEMENLSLVQCMINLTVSKRKKGVAPTAVNGDSPVSNASPLASPNFDTVHPVVPAVVAVPAVPAVVPPPHDGYLRLKNIANDCFVNAMVNALHACNGFVDLVIRSPGDDLVLKELQTLYAHPSSALHARDLRRRTRWNDNDMGEPEEIFQRVYRGMTTEMRKMFEYRVRWMKQCGCFDGKQHPEGEWTTDYNFIPSLFDYTFDAITFTDLVRYPEARRQGSCDLCGQRATRWQIFMASREQEYLKMNIGRNNFQLTRAFSITNFNPEVVNIMGARWRLVSAVERLPVHYTCIRRGINDWIYQNDDSISHRDNIDSCLKVYTSLFFQRQTL